MRKPFLKPVCFMLATIPLVKLYSHTQGQSRALQSYMPEGIIIGRNEEPGPFVSP
jgi:hypothetical protein